MSSTPHPFPHRRGALPRLSQFALDHLLLLPLGAIVAMVWVNTGPERYYEFTYSIAFAVNDVAMIFFFALMTKEVVEATAPGGVLHTRRRAFLPIVGAIGAAAVPALLYLRAVDALDEPMLSLAWPVLLSTDIALTYLMARLIFRTHPVVPFLLLLAIATDVFGFVALAVFNPVGDELHPFRGAILLAVAIALAIGIRRAGIRSFWPYILVAGTVSWCAFYVSGFHPALALVPIVPFLPHVARDPGFFVDASPNAPDALSQFEIWWRYPAHVTLFFFGLVNAGAPLHALEPGTLGIPLALIVGRPIGLLAAVGIAVTAGLRLPHNVSWRDLIVVGLMATVGFSIGLFLCTALLPAGQLRSEVSMGVLLGLIGGPLALVAARLLRVGRFGHHAASSR